MPLNLTHVRSDQQIRIPRQVWEFFLKEHNESDTYYKLTCVNTKLNIMGLEFFEYIESK